MLGFSPFGQTRLRAGRRLPAVTGVATGGGVIKALAQSCSTLGKLGYFMVLAIDANSCYE